MEVIWGKDHEMGILKNLGILGIIGFSIGLIFYVSVPDYPRSACAWEIMLWGEGSQWWSEVSWILAFLVFSVALTYVVEWQGCFPNKRIESYQFYIRVVFGIAFLLLLFDFSIVYFHWDGWVNSIALDRGGWLHGIFYLSVALEGLLLFEELMGLGCRVISRLGNVANRTD